MISGPWILYAEVDVETSEDFFQLKLLSAILVFQLSPPDLPESGMEEALYEIPLVRVVEVHEDESELLKLVLPGAADD